MFIHDGDFEKLCQILNYQFRNKALLAQAITTKAAWRQNSHKANGHHEEMAFFGDGILRMVVDKVLMEEFPYYQVGELSKTRDLLVKDINLIEAAKRLQLEQFIYMDALQTKACQQGTPKLLADTVEAIIYAIYKDSNENLLEVKNFIFSHSSISQILEQEQVRIKESYGDILQAIYEGDVQTVQRLLKQGCPANFKFMWTDFHYDDDPEEPGQIGENIFITPLEHALDCMSCYNGDGKNQTPANYLKIIQLLLEHEAKLNLVPDLSEKLFPHSLHYHKQTVSDWELFLNQVIAIFFRCRVSLDGEDYQHDNTILQLAIINRQPSTIDLLLQHKTNPNIQNKNGETALHLAASFSDLALTRKLLVADANPIIIDENSLKAFDRASSDEIKKILLMAEIKYGTQKTPSESYLISAFYESGKAYFNQHKYQKAQSLLARANILYLLNNTTPQTQTSQYQDMLNACEKQLALNNPAKQFIKTTFYSASDDKAQIAQPESSTSLLKDEKLAYQELNQKLFFSISTGNDALVKALLKKGADGNAVTEEKKPVLHQAIHRYLDACFSRRILIDRYAKMSINPYSHKKIVEILLNFGADPNQRDTKGRTALHLAIMLYEKFQQDQEDVIYLLLQHGANPSLRDKENNFASHYTHNPKIRSVLIQKTLTYSSQAIATPSSSITTASSSTAQIYPIATTTKCKFFQPQIPNSCNKGNQCEFSHTL